MPSINIPFSGFYDSLWSSEIDRAQEQDAEHFAQEDEGAQPTELQITEDEFNDFLFACADYSSAYLSIARAYVDGFGDVIAKNIGIQLNEKFDGMSSPREYNFETDRLFIEVPDATVATLFAASAEDEHSTLASMIEGRHTSRSGFISYYQNQLDEWLAKPLNEWDHNELGTLLRAVMQLRGTDSEFGMSIYYSIEDGFWEAWQNCVDWKKFDEKVAERRAELVAEKQETDPDYVAPYRCPETLDLFEVRP